MEILVQARFKNGLLYKAVQKCGNQSKLARYLDVSPTSINRWLNFQDVPKFRNYGSIKPVIYERWDELLVALVGFGLEEIFPVELETHNVALKEKARQEAFVEMPVETLISSGAVGALPPAPDEAILKDEVKQMLNDILITLKPREEKVIKLRFGLDGNEPHTLEETAQRFAVTRERVRQIEAKALRKLRQPNCSRVLKEYYV